MSWPALESDPEIFTNYFRSLGLSPEWEFGEVFSLDEEVSGSALILVYRNAGQDPAFNGTPVPSRYYIKQVEALDNACGLLAGLHGILNSDAEILNDSLLASLKAGVEDKTPIEAGNWLLANQSLQQAHGLYAAEGQSNLTNAPTHHFIAILDGLKLFDGMKESPIALADQQGFSLRFFEILQGLIASGSVAEDISLMILRRNL
jgi:Ubiquitin carboxyl-terminal hydrolase, family 1.